MAMNKAERAAFELTHSELAIARALRWSRYEPLEPDQPKPPPNGLGAYIEGWGTYAYVKRVKQQWSQSISHGDGPYQKEDRHRSASQGGRALYSTKLLALQALRYEVERSAAKDLADIDAQIKAEQEGDKP